MLPFRSKITCISLKPHGKKVKRKERIVEKPDLRGQRTETETDQEGMIGIGENQGGTIGIGEIEVENKEEEEIEKIEE